MLSEPNRQMTQTPAWINRAAYRDRHISAIRAPLQDLSGGRDVMLDGLWGERRAAHRRLSSEPCGVIDERRRGQCRQCRVITLCPTSEPLGECNCVSRAASILVGIEQRRDRPRSLRGVPTEPTAQLTPGGRFGVENLPSAVPIDHLPLEAKPPTTWAELVWQIGTWHADSLPSRSEY